MNVLPLNLELCKHWDLKICPLYPAIYPKISMELKTLLLVTLRLDILQQD